MTLVLVTLTALSAALAWLGGLWVCKNATRLGLIQAPNQRSSHVWPTPTGGGLGFVVAASLAGLGGLCFSDWPEGSGVLGLAAALAAVGLRDDIRHVPALLRFGTQACVVIGLVLLLGSLSGLGLSEAASPVALGWLMGTLLLLAGIWWINLFNFMDGIDGIAAAQAIFMLGMASALAVAAEPAASNDAAWWFMVMTSGAVGGFLILNWPPARVFMGDVGSTWLAFVILALGLISIERSWLTHATWLILSATFVVDATVTLTTRVLRRERWYEAHRSHAYQQLSRRWNGDRKVGHRSVTLLVMAINLLWLAPLAWATQIWPDHSWAMVAVAYVPLVMASCWVGAGRSDRA
jgi:Fuc2NAc and GlcNAc transferase